MTSMCAARLRYMFLLKCFWTIFCCRFGSVSSLDASAQEYSSARRGAYSVFVDYARLHYVFFIPSCQDLTRQEKKRPLSV